MNNDLISREALKEFINEVCFSKEWAKYRADKGTRGQIECILTYIDNAPAVDTYTIEDIQEVRENSLILGAKLAQRPQGEWEPNSFQFECNLCENLNAYKSNFCPNCGAKMKDGADNVVYAPELYQGCLTCDAHKTCVDAFCSHAVNCNAYGKGGTT